MPMTPRTPGLTPRMGSTGSPATWVSHDFDSADWIPGLEYSRRRYSNDFNFYVIFSLFSFCAFPQILSQYFFNYFFCVIFIPNFIFIFPISVAFAISN